MDRAEISALTEVAKAWDALATKARSPFLTVAWFEAYANAFPDVGAHCTIVRDAGGDLRAGACWSAKGGALRSLASGGHSGTWDVLAADDASRADLWERVARTGYRRIELTNMPDTESGATLAASILRAAGYRVLAEKRPMSPYLVASGDWDMLLAGRTKNLRSNYRRRRKQLAEIGPLRLRTLTDIYDLDADLATLIQIEASGWKGRAGTSISSSPETQKLYTEFARSAADAGWLRLRLLEVGEIAVAGDLSVQFAGCESLLKTAYNEEHARVSPGLVLRGESLRAMLDEGVREYDFLGDADPYKMHWATEIRPRVRLYAFSGTVSIPAYLYRSTLRPRLRATYRRLRRRSFLPAPTGAS